MSDLLFDKKTHEYKLDGVKIASVTEITKAVTGKDVSNIPPGILKAAGDRGRAIHADVESETYETPEGKWIFAEIIGEKYAREVQGSGEYAGLRFAGTADLVGEKEIVDIKTESDEDLLYWTIQLNLYRVIFPREKLSVLWTPNTGNYKRIPIKILSEEKLTEIIDAWKSGKMLPTDWLDGPVKEAPSLDLIVHTLNVGKLTTNAKAILETVRRQLGNYKAENYSEENIQAAKRDKAELNAASKKLNDKRIELEREFMKPFAEFKDTIATTCDEIKKASSLIDSVVKEVEEREKAEKRKLLEESWVALDCALFPLSKIWNPQWLNKTVKAKDVVVEMGERIEKAKADLAVLDRLGEPDAKAYYLDTLNLEGALAEADRIKANRARLEEIERQRKEAEARKAEQPKEELKAEVVKVEEHHEEKPAETKAEEVDEILERTIKVRCAKSLMVALGDWMNERGIEYERV